MTIPVHQTKPAHPSVAGWIQALLGPAVLACRIGTPPPLELRPTGQWGGWCTSGHGVNDRRVQVSGRSVFWSKQNFVFIYLHETVHRLFADLGHQDFHHNAAFFALQFLFLQRLDQSNYLVNGCADWSTDARLYDLQDPPDALKNEPIDVWLPRCLAWALAAAEALANTDLTAEKSAAELVFRYKKWCSDLEKEPAEIAAAEAAEIAKRRAIQKELAALRDLARYRFWYSFAGFSGFFASFFAFIFLVAK